MASYSPLNDCSIGILIDTVCHLQSFTSMQGMIIFEYLDENDQQIILLRTKLNSGSIVSVCEHHFAQYITCFVSFQKKCCNPFGAHRKPITLPKGQGKEILLEESVILGEILNTSVIPGKKVCVTCKIKMYEILKEYEQVQRDKTTELDIVSPNLELRRIEEKVARENLLAKFNATIGLYDLTPASNLPRENTKEKGKLNVVYGQFFSPVQDNDTKEKAVNFDTLMAMVKSKIQETDNPSKRIHLLTLAPISWSTSKLQEYFQVTSYQAKEAKRLFQEKGILSFPNAKKGKPLHKDIEEMSLQFYEDDEYSREMPGQKDVISIDKKQYKQKRLMLLNLKELYQQFLMKYQDHTEVRIGFSKFCSLRPKWCILPGASGTHSVCVCVIHQNAKLLVDALQIQENYSDLMNYIVCSIDNRECMIHRCEKCPGRENLRDHLYDSLEDREDSQIIYQLWIGTDRTTLSCDTTSLYNLIDMVVTSIDELTSHSYIARAQSRYLKVRKENLDNNTVIVLCDFAENFSFVIQDEIQSYHWSQNQATLHPIVIYYKTDDTITHQSFCFISDEVHHDTTMVYSIQKMFITHIKRHFPKITKVEYFSDGCAAQYKNKYNFTNLCMHEHDFGLSAEWNFFATAHGKSPCDGIGGSVKRVTAVESLKRIKYDRIQTPEEMYTFCHKHFSHISFFYIPKSEIEQDREFLKARFAHAKRIPGTRSYHRFKPIGVNVLEVMRSSDQKGDLITLNFDLTDNAELTPFFIGNYVACMYDTTWWIGVILNVFEEEGDAEIQLMHFNDKTRTFKWPVREDKCLFPLTRILCKICTPSATTSYRRQYRLPAEELNMVEQRFKDYISK